MYVLVHPRALVKFCTCVYCILHSDSDLSGGGLSKATCKMLSRISRHLGQRLGIDPSITTKQLFYYYAYGRQCNPLAQPKLSTSSYSEQHNLTSLLFVLTLQLPHRVFVYPLKPT